MTEYIHESYIDSVLDGRLTCDTLRFALIVRVFFSGRFNICSEREEMRNYLGLKTNSALYKKISTAVRSGILRSEPEGWYSFIGREEFAQDHPALTLISIRKDILLDRKKFRSWLYSAKKTSKAANYGIKQSDGTYHHAQSLNYIKKFIPRSNATIIRQRRRGVEAGFIDAESQYIPLYPCIDYEDAVNQLQEIRTQFSFKDRDKIWIKSFKGQLYICYFQPTLLKTKLHVKFLHNRDNSPYRYSFYYGFNDSKGGVNSLETSVPKPFSREASNKASQIFLEQHLLIDQFYKENRYSISLGDT